MGPLRTIGAGFCAALTLAACGGDNRQDENESGGVALSLFSPAGASPAFPFPNDILFIENGAVADDGTINLPNAEGAEPQASVNRLDGFSTVASAFTDFLFTPVDPDSADEGLVVFALPPGGAPERLVPNEDYQVVAAPVIPAGPSTRLLIQPLRPLAAGTRHAVFVTDALRTTDGGNIEPSNQFRVVANPDPVGTGSNPASAFSADQQVILEGVRAGLIRPLFDALIEPAMGPDPTPDIDAEDVLVAWSFTTQSIGASLDLLAANPTPSTIGVVDTGMTTADLGAPAGADIFAGSMTLPYYLDAPSAENPTAPLTSFWQPTTDGAGAGTFAPIGVPCETVPAPSQDDIPAAGGEGAAIAIAELDSTTSCFPEPRVKTEGLTVPVLVTRPTGMDAPDGGFPVVIFQHGITGNRTNALAVAPALAAAGFVTVAIDLPLHGITDPENPLFTDDERTFDLDLVANDTGAPGPDGVIDGSGSQFINLSSLITSRDNNRQAVADLINVNATLAAGDIVTVDPASGAPTGSIAVDGGNQHFFGFSLGGIVGGTLLGVVDDGLGAATLANPGGGIGRLLDGSAAFGPQIAAGLAANEVMEGTDAYETFLRFAQTLIDSGDPINYAQAAADAHALHLIEVVGGANDGANPADLVVPNFVVQNQTDDGPCPVPAENIPFLDTACVDGPLSGTDPLIAEMGLNSITIEPPYEQAASQPADTAVRFTAGTHSSLLLPTPGDTPGVTAEQAAQTTAEMQRQAAAFLGMAAAGVPEPTIPIGSPTAP